MQIIDNWAIVRGQVAEIRKRVNRTTVILNVAEVEDYENYPNLLSWSKGQLISVDFPVTFQYPEVGASVEWILEVVSPGNSVPHPSSLAS